MNKDIFKTMFKTYLFLLIIHTISSLSFDRAISKNSFTDAINNDKQNYTDLTLSLDQETDKIYDYAVLGAGLSGLRAAELLLKKNKSFIVLEAQDVVGGKVASKKIKDIPQLSQKRWFKDNAEKYQGLTIDLGAAQIEIDHYQVLERAKKLGLKMKTLVGVEQKQYIISGEAGGMQKIGQLYRTEIMWFFLKLDKHAVKLDKAIGKIQKKYDQKAFDIVQRYDKAYAKDFIQNELGLKKNPILKEIIFSQLEAMLSESIDNIGALSFILNFQDFLEILDYFDLPVLKDHFDLQQKEPALYIEGGNHQLPLKMSKQILQNGGQIRFKHEVVKIDNSNYKKEIIVHAKIEHQNSSEEVKIKAKNIMFGLPRRVAKDIEISNLSQTKRKIFNQVLQTQLLKSFLFLKRQVEPIKRSGGIFLDTAYLGNIVENISPKEQQSLGIYVFYHSKRTIPQFLKLSVQQRQQYMKKVMMKGFQLNETDEELRHILDESVYIQSNIGKNRFLKSVYSTVYKPNFYTSIINSGGSLKEIDCDEFGMSFITSQFSDTNNGYMEGALQNGELSVFLRLKKDYLQKVGKERYLVEAKKQIKKL